MDDKKAADILAAMKGKYPFTADEAAAIEAAAGLLGMAASLGGRLRKIGEARRAKRASSAEWE